MIYLNSILLNINSIDSFFNVKKMRSIVPALILVFFCYSCHKSKTAQKLDAKEITYKITYSKEIDNEPVVALLPDKMHVYYTQNYVCHRAEGWLGLFFLSQIVDLQDSTRTILLKIVDKKYAYKQKISEKSLKFEQFDDFIVDEKEKNIDFRGLKAIEKKLYLKNDENSTLTIVYTHDFDIRTPNIGSPYAAINGVLLLYPMMSTGVPMQVEYLCHNDTIIDSSMLKIPENYNVVTRDVIEAVFDNYTPN